jgi:hypothetical protein
MNLTCRLLEFAEMSFTLLAMLPFRCSCSQCVATTWPFHACPLVRLDIAVDLMMSLCSAALGRMSLLSKVLAYRRTCSFVLLGISVGLMMSLSSVTVPYIVVRGRLVG